MYIYKKRISEYMKFAKCYEEECRQILNDEQKIEMLFVSLMDCNDSAKMRISTRINEKIEKNENMHKVYFMDLMMELKIGWINKLRGSKNIDIAIIYNYL
ncbi:1763_t:CDS:2 [Gigaspora rosea]|nr:1763_t:CDS:2 [Gigaspora rosea]